jgi:hypothetical protein
MAKKPLQGFRGQRGEAPLLVHLWIWNLPGWTINGEEEKMRIRILSGMIMLASVFVAMMPVGSAEAEVSFTRIKLWHILLAIAILLLISTFTYLLVGRMRRKGKIIKILKEAKLIEEELEKEGLTKASDVVLAQILCGISDIKALVLFCMGVLVAFNLTIISML